METHPFLSGCPSSDVASLKPSRHRSSRYLQLVERVVSFQLLSWILRARRCSEPARSRACAQTAWTLPSLRGQWPQDKARLYPILDQPVPEKSNQSVSEVKRCTESRTRTLKILRNDPVAKADAPSRYADTTPACSSPKFTANSPEGT